MRLAHKIAYYALIPLAYMTGNADAAKRMWEEIEEENVRNRLN